MLYIILIGISAFVVAGIIIFLSFHKLPVAVIDRIKRLNYDKKLKVKGYSFRQVLGLPDGTETHVESITDKFRTLYEISDAVKAAGLEHSDVIIGIDFSASNEWQGRNCFNHRSLHDVSKKQKNPYQQVISVIPDVLEPFDEDNLIPVFGFGCSRTKDKTVFPFNENEAPCKGFLDVLEQYERVRTVVELSGPTSLVPIIRKAIEITSKKHTYHILVIIMDGQVEEDQDQATQEAIIEASLHPLSIIVVGVGDGPWDKMKDYDDRLPSRQFDNFHFVDYHEVTNKHCRQPLMNFALHALMEIPDQYKKIKKLGLIKKPHHRCCKHHSDGERHRDGEHRHSVKKHNEGGTHNDNSINKNTNGGDHNHSKHHSHRKHSGDKHDHYTINRDHNSSKNETNDGEPKRSNTSTTDYDSLKHTTSSGGEHEHISQDKSPVTRRRHKPPGDKSLSPNRSETVPRIEVNYVDEAVYV